MPLRRALPLALAAACVLGPALAAQAPAEGARRRTAAVRLAGPAPAIDGALDDAAWAAAPVATGFVQRAPDPGAPATLPTEARVLYDDEAVYVALRAIDPAPDSILAPLGRRDLYGIASDWVHVVLDSYADRRTAFRFSVNARGVQKDAYHFNDGNEDLGWDAVWQSAVRRDAGGWSAEMRIPLSQLRFSRGAGERPWGVQFIREIGRRAETTDWSPVSPGRPGFVSQFGELTGIEGLRPGRRLEVLPYTLARVTRSPGDADDPFHDGTEPFGAVGADVRYGLTSDFTLTATLNPDFGQVEADPSQVNLSAFETFFAERRPFFLEGSDLFRFGMSFPYGVRGASFGADQPFYSRRLGRAPQGSVPDEAEFSEPIDATTILGAAKITGKTSSGWSVGLLNALTAREEAPWIDGAGVRRRSPVEPLTNYFAGRVIRDFRGGSSAVGGIVTHLHRALPEDGTLGFLASDALAAGLDGRHRFGGGSFEARASVLATHVRGGTEAITGIQRRAGHYFQRPDADHLSVDSAATSLTGWLADVKVEKVAGGYWRGGLYGHARSPGLELNDVGFQRSTDWALAGGWLGYNHFRPTRAFRRWEANVNAWNGWSFGGERLSTGFNVNTSANFHNNYYVYAGTDTELEALRADVLRGGPAFVGPAYTSAYAGGGTDGRKPVVLEVEGNVFNEYGTDGHGWGFGPSVTVRPSGRLRLTLSPRVDASRDPWIYVAQRNDAGGTRRYVFADIRQRSVSMGARMNYAFSPALTLELYAQPFLAAGEYSSFQEVTDPRARRFADRMRPYAANEIALDEEDGVYRVDRGADGTEDFSFDRPDFNVQELRSNLVLRWEYRPGSTLFVVWAHDRAGYVNDGRFRFGRDVGRLFGRDDAVDVPSTDVLLVKFNYWVNF